MTEDEWKELENLPVCNWITLEQEDRYHELLEMTEHEDEHPEWYDGPCICLLCLSYGD